MSHRGRQSRLALPPLAAGEQTVLVLVLSRTETESLLDLDALWASLPRTSPRRASPSTMHESGLGLEVDLSA